MSRDAVCGACSRKSRQSVSPFASFAIRWPPLPSPHMPGWVTESAKRRCDRRIHHACRPHTRRQRPREWRRYRAVAHHGAPAGKTGNAPQRSKSFRAAAMGSRFYSLVNSNCPAANARTSSQEASTAASRNSFAFLRSGVTGRPDGAGIGELVKVADHVVRP